MRIMSKTRTKGVSGIEMLIPIFLMMFSLIVIFAGIEWGVNTLVLMDEEKQVTQMDTELLSVTDLYITPSLKYAMQEVTRDLALHGGLSSDILDNYKLFVESGMSDSDKDDLEDDIVSDFNNGNLNFPSITNPPMKVEGDILYWSYYDKVSGTNNETIPYEYDFIGSITPYNLCGTCSLEWSPPYTYLITDIKGTVNRYDVDDGNYILSGQYTGPTVISGNTQIKLNMSKDTESAKVEGVYNIRSYFEPLFPSISYPGDALAQRTVFPRFTDVMLSDRLNNYRSDYGDSKTDIGSTLSLGTWNAFFVPVLMELDKTLAFYGGNRLVESTSSIKMENDDPVKSELDNRYWKLYDIATLFMDDVTDNDFLDDPLTMNAYYSEKYAAPDLFRDMVPKTCSEEWQGVLGDPSYSCDGQQDNNIYSTEPQNDKCTNPSSHTDSSTHIREIILNSGEHMVGDTLQVEVGIDCGIGDNPVDDKIYWTISYSADGIEWDNKETDSFTCGYINALDTYKRIKRSFTILSARPTQYVRASVTADPNEAGSTCMTGDKSDNDDMTFDIITSYSSGNLYSPSADDSCFDGDDGCSLKDTCSLRYADNPPVLTPKDSSDQFSILKNDRLYRSKPLTFDVMDNFNNNYRKKFTDMGLVPFIYETINKTTLADNITLADEVYFTFNYGSTTTLGCSEREDIISDVSIFLTDSSNKNILIGSFNPDLKGTDSEDFFKKQTIVLDTTAKSKIAQNIKVDGKVNFVIGVTTEEYGENLPAQMYTERNSRVYVYDVLTKGVSPSMTIDINPDYMTDSLEPSMDYGFKNAKGVAVDKDGNIYVIDSDDPRLYRYNSFGTFNGWMDLPGLDPRGVDIDTSNGNIYISYHDGQNITRYDNFFDSRDLVQDAGIPQTPFQMCGRFANANPIDVAFYKGTIFTIFEDDRLDYCKSSSNSWYVGSLPDVAGTDKIMAISVDQAEDRLYAKVNKPTGNVDVNGNPTYYRHYYVYDLSGFVDDPTTSSITRISGGTIPIDFSLTYFDIYTPQKGGDTQAYFTYMTKTKKDTSALLDDFRFNIDFGDTFKIEVESMDNVKGLTDRIEYYEDKCGPVILKENCQILWSQYALNEYYDKFDLYNRDNCGAGATAEDAAIVKSLLGLPQSANIPCSQTIDSANIIPFPGTYMEVKMKDKIIGPRIEALVRQYNDHYNGDEIYINIDYKIDSDFGMGWDSDEYWEEKDSFGTGSINTGVACSCSGKSQTCLSGYSGNGVSSTIHRTDSWCEYKYGAIYSFNITIEDKNTDVWDPVLHRMTTLKFKYGFEWSDIDDSITITYTADERDLGTYLAGDEAYCAPAYTPDVCHVQNGIANYYHHINDPAECPGREGTGVTYNVLHCQDDDYGLCYGPLHKHCRSCGLGCKSCYSHRHKSCYNYGCQNNYNNAVNIDYNHYETCHGPQAPPTPPTPPTEEEDDEDEDSVVCLNMTLDVVATTGVPDPVSDFVNFSYDISSLGSSSLDTTFTPGTPSPVSPIGCNSGYAGSLKIYVNKSYVGELFVEPC